MGASRCSQVRPGATEKSTWCGEVACRPRDSLALTRILLCMSRLLKRGQCSVLSLGDGNPKVAVLLLQVSQGLLEGTVCSFERDVNILLRRVLGFLILGIVPLVGVVLIALVRGGECHPVCQTTMLRPFKRDPNRDPGSARGAGYGTDEMLGRD